MGESYRVAAAFFSSSPRSRGDARDRGDDVVDARGSNEVQVNVDERACL